MVQEGGAGADAVWMIRWAKEVMGWNDGEWGTGISEGAEVVLLGASMQGEDTGAMVPTGETIKEMKPE